MTAEQIAKKYVHGLHDALTDRQEIKDMMADIETYADYYHQAKLKELGIANVVGQREQLKCSNCELDYDKEEIEMFRGLCESCRDRAF